MPVKQRHAGATYVLPIFLRGRSLAKVPGVAVSTWCTATTSFKRASREALDLEPAATQGEGYAGNDCQCRSRGEGRAADHQSEVVRREYIL